MAAGPSLCSPPPPLCTRQSPHPRGKAEAAPEQSSTPCTKTPPATPAHPRIHTHRSGVLCRRGAGGVPGVPDHRLPPGAPGPAAAARRHLGASPAGGPQVRKVGGKGLWACEATCSGRVPARPRAAAVGACSDWSAPRAQRRGRGGWRRGTRAMGAHPGRGSDTLPAPPLRPSLRPCQWAGGLAAQLCGAARRRPGPGHRPAGRRAGLGRPVRARRRHARRVLQASGPGCVGGGGREPIIRAG